jgi:hypothetical protein
MPLYPFKEEDFHCIDGEPVGSFYNLHLLLNIISGFYYLECKRQDMLLVKEQHKNGKL